MLTTSAARPSAVENARALHPGMGAAVAERTYLRRILTEEAVALLDPDITLNPSDPHLRQWLTALHNTGGFRVSISQEAAVRGMQPPTRWETWGELAGRVSYGNASLVNLQPENEALVATEQTERDMLGAMIAKGTCIMSGRHLQHGDQHQINRPMEVFTNCSTSATSFTLFYLLLNGSGVGRCYDDDMMLVNWDHMPTVRVVLDEAHPDFDHQRHTSVRDAKHLYGKGDKVHWFEVPDSREGWAEAVELLEVMTYQKVFRDELLVLDFSKVREKNAPIMGMQGRPSSGPVPLMSALEMIAQIKGAGMAPWKQSLYVDHYLAMPVLVGGARRAARMSTKHWSDKDIIDFIQIKRPIEYDGLDMDEVVAFRTKHMEEKGFAPMAFLWSSNNSVTVDEEFWRRALLEKGHADYQSPLSVRARAVLASGCECSYGDGTGEPGFINEDKLTKNDKGTTDDAFKRGDYVGSDRYQVKDETRMYLARLNKKVQGKPNAYIVNPCGEIVLRIVGSFCVIADVVPFHCDTLEEAEETVRAATRALIRVNMMDSIYNAEVKRTNRIGVGLTGIHEFAWKFFNVGFHDLVNPDFDGWSVDKNIDMGSPFFSHANHSNPRIRAAAFWSTLGAMSRAVYHEAVHYSSVLGVEVPHTMTTIKPSGSVSKLFGLTEGWHLPSMLHYMRWVQYRNDDPQLDDYRELGYPVRELKVYRGHTIVGFPTEPTITTLDGYLDAAVTAGEASMDDQFQWLRLGEAFWLEGHDPQSFLAGFKALPDYGNQISYTLKYRPNETSYDTFKDMMALHQPTVRCCSVMPQSDDMTAYEYLPEEAVSKAQFEQIARAIRRTGITEDIGQEHIGCDTGACPVNFVEDKSIGA